MAAEGGSQLIFKSDDKRREISKKSPHQADNPIQLETSTAVAVANGLMLGAALRHN